MSSTTARIRNFAVLAMLTLAGALVNPALGHAQNGPIKILVGLPPGGAVDIAARLVGEKLQGSLGQPVIVENKPGASTRIAVQALRASEPNGQTLLVAPDATVTLFRRMARREPFWAAHRSHFYQRATDNGFSVSRVVGEVFALNILLAALAIGSAMTSSAAIAILFFVIGGIATAFLMRRFSRRLPPN